MQSIVTTHNLDIFKSFYFHKYHKIFLDNLYLYVDKEDSSEFEKLIAKEDNVKIFNKRDFIEFFGDNYIPEMTTFSKVYFIYYLIKKNLLTENFYFTDDDIHVIHTSFNEIANSKKAIFNKDQILIIDRMYYNWEALKSWLNENYIPENTLSVSATNFYFPDNSLEEFKKAYVEVFDSLIEVLKSERNFIIEESKSSKSQRGTSFKIFYLDTPFFNTVFQRLDKDLYERKNIKLLAYSHLRKAKEYLKSTDTHKCLSYIFNIKTEYPKTQPLFHYNINNKVPLIKEIFNFLNGIELKYKNVNDLLAFNPKENNRLNSTKSLF